MASGVDQLYKLIVRIQLIMSMHCMLHVYTMVCVALETIHAQNEFIVQHVSMGVFMYVMFFGHCLV